MLIVLPKIVACAFHFRLSCWNEARLFSNIPSALICVAKCRATLKSLSPCIPKRKWQELQASYVLSSSRDLSNRPVSPSIQNRTSSCVCVRCANFFLNLKFSISNFKIQLIEQAQPCGLTSFQVSVMLIVIVKIPESATYCLAILMLQFQCTSLLETE